MAIFTGSLLLDLLGIFTAVVVGIYTYFKWSFQYWKWRNVPYLEPKMPFGNFDNPATSTRSAGEECTDLYRKAKARGLKYCGIYSMVKPTLLVLDLELVKRIMAKDFSHFTDRGFYTVDSDPLSGHLLAIGGEKWKNLRVKLSPTFSSGKMRTMFQTVANTGLILEKHLDEYVSDKKPVDINDVTGRFTTEIIGSCAFGLDCNSFTNPEDPPFKMYGNKFFRPSKLHFLKLIICSNFPNLGRALGLAVTPRDVSDFYTNLAKDTVTYREENNIVRKDFLQLLIDIKNNTEGKEDGLGDHKTLTMNEIAAQCFLFFLAGFETSTNTMTLTLFELATHPEIQRKAREEITSVLAKHDNKITYDSLNDLKYMRQVIDETLRKYPALPVITRECVEDYKIPGEDVVIQKGVRVFIPVQGIHYDEEYFKNPEEFDPDRFSEENKSKRHHYAQLGFGEGPRICIGERFGVMQTKVGLTTILRRYNVKLNGRTPLPLKMSKASIVPTNEGEIWLDLERI